MTPYRHSFSDNVFGKRLISWLWLYRIILHTKYYVKAFFDYLLFHLFRCHHHYLKRMAFHVTCLKLYHHCCNPQFSPCKSIYTFEVKDAVYKAVKQDGMSWTHADSVFWISGGKWAVKENVLGRPSHQLVGFRRCRFAPHIILQLETTVIVFSYPLVKLLALTYVMSCAAYRQCASWEYGLSVSPSLSRVDLSSSVTSRPRFSRTLAWASTESKNSAPTWFKVMSMELILSPLPALCSSPCVWVCVWENLSSSAYNNPLASFPS